MQIICLIHITTVNLVVCTAHPSLHHVAVSLPFPFRHNSHLIMPCATKFTKWSTTRTFGFFSLILGSILLLEYCHLPVFNSDVNLLFCVTRKPAENCVYFTTVSLSIQNGQRNNDSGRQMLVRKEFLDFRRSPKHQIGCIIVVCLICKLLFSCILLHTSVSITHKLR